MTTCFNVKKLTINGRPAKKYYAICFISDEWEIGVDITVDGKMESEEYNYEYCKVHRKGDVEIALFRGEREEVKRLYIKPAYEEIDFEGEGERSHE